MKDDPGKRSVKDSLLGGFSPLLAKLKERQEERKELYRRLREAIFTHTPAERTYTRKSEGAKRKVRRRKNKAAKQARKLNRKGKGRPKGYK